MGTAALGIPLLFALELFAERRRASIGDRVVLWIGAVAVLVAFAMAWFDWSAAVATGRYVQISTGVHLLVAFLPFVGVDEPGGFWEYNRGLLHRFLTAVVYTSVLYTGLAVALLAIDNLLGVEVDGSTYLRLWIVIGFVFNTWFFLAGVPEHLEELESHLQYPRELKAFAQYLLIPIVIVYLIILTVYLGKVIVTGEWPSGWIGYLVSSVAAIGIFSLLLVYPIADREENRWISSYSRIFYFALFPPVVMLWLAVWKRVDQYGITERRYFLIILSVWLASIAVYYAFTRSRSIRVIPISLAILAFATFAGPWGAYAVSASSQMGRLESILVRNEMLRDGTLEAPVRELSFEDRRELSAIARYMVETHGTARFEPWFDGRLASIDTIGQGTAPSSRAGDTYARAKLVIEAMGVVYVDRWASGDLEYFNFSVNRDEVVGIAGYDHMRWIDGLIDQDSQVVMDDVVVEYDSASVGIVLSRDGAASAMIPLRPLLEAARKARLEGGSGGGLSPDLLRAEIDTDWITAAVLVRRVRGRFPEGETPRIESMQFTLLMRVNDGSESRSSPR